MRKSYLEPSSLLALLLFQMLLPALLALLVGVEIVHAHLAISAIATQALEALIGDFLTGIEILAVLLALELYLAFIPVVLCRLSFRRHRL